MKIRGILKRTGFGPEGIPIFKLMQHPRQTANAIEDRRGRLPEAFL